MIYLDNNATTCLDPDVLAAMQAEMALGPSNPSSAHALGRAAQKRLYGARLQMANYLGAKADEICFTASATEALNQLIHGFFARYPNKQILTTRTEHHAILKPLEAYASRTLYLPIDDSGVINLDVLKAALNQNIGMILISGANSETGIKQPLEEIGKIALHYGLFLGVDAVAMLGKERVTLFPGISALVLSAHKCHGPKGIGALWLDSRFALPSLILGGAQELGRRAGTENLPAIIGFAKSVEKLVHLSQIQQEMERLRDLFEARLSAMTQIEINGKGARLCNTSNISFLENDAETLLIQLDRAGIAVSHGSACSSGLHQLSHVLIAMGLSHARVRSSLRFSLSRHTTQAEIEKTLSTLSACLKIPCAH